MSDTKRFIKVYPDEVAVCTLGPKGDGSDNIIDRYPNCKVIYTYNNVTITDKDDPNTGWVTEVDYPTQEIVFISTD